MKFELRFDTRSVIEELRRADLVVREAFQASTRAEAERIMAKSQEQVPEDTGFLKSSKVIKVQNHADGCSITLAYTAPYALAVHEIPPPSGGGRSAVVRRDRRAAGNTRTAFHPQGKWKFLEDPWKEAVAGMDARIVRGMMRILNSALRRGKG